MIIFMINLVSLLVKLFSLLVLIHVILSYFLSPFHPIRTAIDRIVEPLLKPIRQVVPAVGMFDFSPIILLVLTQIFGSIVINLLRILL